MVGHKTSTVSYSKHLKCICRTLFLPQSSKSDTYLKMRLRLNIIIAFFLNDTQYSRNVTEITQLIFRIAIMLLNTDIQQCVRIAKINR